MRGGVVAGILSPPVNGLFRSGHPRALSPTQTRQTTMTPHRRRSLFILSDIIANPTSSPGSDHSSPLINTPPSFRLPPYRIHIFRRIASHPVTIFWISSRLPNLSCVSSPHTQHVNASMFSPSPYLFPFVLCFVHLINRFTLLCIFYSHSFNDCDGDDESSLIIIVTTFFFFSLSFYVMFFYCFSSLPPISFFILGMPGAFFFFFPASGLCDNLVLKQQPTNYHHHQQQVYQVSTFVVLPPGVFY